MINRALILTTKTLDNFSAEHIKLDFFGSGNRNSFIINKNHVFKVGNKEFLVRNCEPETGMLTSEATITVENRNIAYISRMRIAVLKVCLYKYLE